MTERRASKPLYGLDALAAEAKAFWEGARSAGVDAAVIGGLAMQFYGSDRLTGDIDFVASGDLDLPSERKLTFGGRCYRTRKGIPVDWVVRSDGFTALYEAALEKAVPAKDGFRIVRPEHLAAMKLATGRVKDYEDLVFLLGEPRLVPRKKARKIVFDLLGGQFAAEEFDTAADEADWRKASGGKRRR